MEYKSLASNDQKLRKGKMPQVSLQCIEKLFQYFRPSRRLVIQFPVEIFLKLIGRKKRWEVKEVSDK